jgi:hypothetical protein
VVKVNGIRFTKPTNNWDAMLDFYRNALALQQLASFEDHDGYDGVMLGLPNAGVHLEITRRKDSSPGPAPA